MIVYYPCPPTIFISNFHESYKIYNTIFKIIHPIVIIILFSVTIIVTILYIHTKNKLYLYFPN